MLLNRTPHASSENVATLSELLTIVIPTRNRLDFLEDCLKSVFDRQTTIPKVIVSDNSTSDAPGMEILRKKYGFSYVRQSGNLSMTQHHNACLTFASTPWAMLLHDDDELYPNILEKMESLLARRDTAGLVVGGIEFIDQKGEPYGAWIPETGGSFKGEDIVLRLGLDFQVSPPGCIWNVETFKQVGGFPDANGPGADYTLVLRLAYSHGVRLFPEIIGRYRIGTQQATDYSTPERAEAILDCSITMAQLTRTIGVSPSAADQLVDYMTWWIFRLTAASLLRDHPFFVSRMCRKCELASPANGVWRERIRSEYPFLFWRPQWLSITLYKIAMIFVPAPARQLLRQRSSGVFNGMLSLRRRCVGGLKRILPGPAKGFARKALVATRIAKARVRLGVNAQPLSYLWGFDRGVPIHRYYLDQFINEFRSDIRGHCLEFQDDAYTSSYGNGAVSKLDILHIDDKNPLATIVADITKANQIPSDTFDCIICTHVLHVIFELETAVSELHRILKPGGVLLTTVPHISMCDPGWHEIWRFTPEGLALVLGKAFGNKNVTVRAFGNSLTAAGELRGLVAHEFSKATLDYHDPRFAVEVCARAFKADRCSDGK
jgi:SAM-dependent methyltransferase